MASKTTRTDHGKDRYLALVRRFPLRPIRSEGELDSAIAAMNALIDQGSRNEAEEDYLDVLSDLVKRYECEEHPMPPVGDSDLLRHLIEAREVSQAVVAAATGIAESTISEVLASKRGLNRTHIGLLARYFNISPAAFAFE